MTTIARPEIRPDPRLFFREKPAPKADQPEAASGEKTAVKAEKAVLCSFCRSVVTRLDRKISVHDHHMHTFFNPAGIVYEVRCFSEAPGCITHGRPTDEFTWFAGYMWEYSLCGTCFDHLGWFYSAREGSFFGLISTKLIIDEPLS